MEATREDRGTMRGPLKLALATASRPWVLGLGINAAWLLAWWFQLFEFSPATASIGIGVFVSGLVLVWFTIRRPPPADSRARRRRKLGILALLAAILCTVGLMGIDFLRLAFGWYLVFDNKSEMPLEDARLSVGRNEIELGTIPAGRKTGRFAGFSGEGSVTLTGTIGGADVEEVVIGYVPSGGGRVDVYIWPDGGIGSKESLWGSRH